VHPRIRTLVVGTSRVDELDPAVPMALALASRLGATLHVVHAYDLPSPIQAAYAREVFLDQQVLDRYGEDLRLRLDATVRPHAAGVELEVHTLEGSAAECITELAEEVGADLVLVGASRGSRIWRHVLGTTAEGVVRATRVPALVLRRPVDPARRVLLTTDLSDGGAELHRRAVRLVRALSGAAELRCVLVVQLDTMPLELRGEMIERLARRELATFLAGAAGASDAGALPEPRIRFGGPANEILSEAAEWQADLVAVGTHGPHGAPRHALGSVAGATLRGTACNVLVVPATPVAEASATPRTERAEPVLHLSG
jgi:universal stress protein E